MQFLVVDIADESDVLFGPVVYLRPFAEDRRLGAAEARAGSGAAATALLPADPPGARSS